MSRSRTYTKAEICDIVQACAEHGMSAILRPTGEMEIFPAIHSRKGSGEVDVAGPSDADKALAKWVAKNGNGENAGRA